MWKMRFKDSFGALTHRFCPWLKVPAMNASEEVREPAGTPNVRRQRWHRKGRVQGKDLPTPSEKTLEAQWVQADRTHKAMTETTLSVVEVMAAMADIGIW